MAELASRGYSQEKRLLRIDTILNNDAAEKRFAGDPLLLAKLDGVEGISRLFAYDVIMLRYAGGQEGERANAARRPPIETRRLIGTRAVIGGRPGSPDKVRLPGEGREEKERDVIFNRVGMFETFEVICELDVLGRILKVPGSDISFNRKRPIRQREYYVYRARVVPWVKVLTRDICYRVFENKTVFDIINAITEAAKKTFPELIIDTSALKQHQFPTMEYCVQYGESTFAFLSRLMRRFGIWYYFGHQGSESKNAPDETENVLNETMILKSNADKLVTRVRFANVECEQEDDPGHRGIGKLVRRFRPPERRVAVGGFNYLDPTRPFYKASAVNVEDDLLHAEGGPPAQTWFSGTTRFADPVFSQPDADALAEAEASQNQSEVLLISGVSKNQTFVAGHRFHIEKPEGYKPGKENEDKPYKGIIDRNFVIDRLKITGTDLTYLHPVLDVGAFTRAVSDMNPEEATDKTNNALFNASLWATKTAQAMIYAEVNPLYGHLHDTAEGRDIDTAENAGAVLEAAGFATEVLPDIAELEDVGKNFAEGVESAKIFLPFLARLFERIRERLEKVAAGKNIATFAVGVIAVPADAPFDPPLPPAGRPVARGPHTAVVIGPDDGKGVDTSEHDIYADAIGRVRIRFPWDPGPPQGDSKIPPVFPFPQSDKPTGVGGNSCWVRIVEGWAGRHYGTQFLPRIGQEVIVDFLDGDPERPVIVGRLYNADKGNTNLPFPDPAVKDAQLKNLTDLPATAKFDLPLSGIKTTSIPSTGKDGTPLKSRFHLLRFSDKRGHEQYLIRSQHRLDITAFSKRFESIGSDRHLTVGGKDPDAEPPQIGGDYIAHVFGDYHLHVGDPEFYNQSGNRHTLIENDDQLKVMGNVDQSVNKDWSTFTGGKATLQASTLGGRIVLFAGANITLTVGASSIVITPAGISITAPTINLVAPGIVSTVPVLPVGAVSLPPELPNNAVPQPPKDPTPADPGNTLTPPE